MCGAWNSCDHRGESLAVVRDVGGFRPVVGVFQASSYAEAAGLLVALREGISPAALGRPLPPLQEIQ